MANSYLLDRQVFAENEKEEHQQGQRSSAFIAKKSHVSHTLFCCSFGIDTKRKTTKIT
jgi:hypothetical protein